MVVDRWGSPRLGEERGCGGNGGDRDRDYVFENARKAAKVTVEGFSCSLHF